MTISDMSTVEAVLMVDETDVPNVKVGQKARRRDRGVSRIIRSTGVVTQVENSPIVANDPDLQGLIDDVRRDQLQGARQDPPPSRHDPARASR